VHVPDPRRVARVLLAALLALAAGACQLHLGGDGGRGGDAPAPASRLDRVLASRELRVGLTGSQPPLNARSRSGEIVGLEVELARALAKSMGLETRFVVLPFAELIPALETDRVDLVISGMTITPERNARVAFAGPYFISGQSVLTAHPELTGLEEADALDDPGRVYAAVAGTTNERFVRDQLPRARLVTVPDHDAGIDLVLSREVDALLADYPICAVAVLRHPEAELSAWMTPFTVEPLGIALPAGDPLFVNLVQNYLTTMEESGILGGLKAKWFSEGPWLSDLP
jgi:polar amino acid transport system substrate-binding protein